MVRNKRAQIFILYAVIFTVFLCAVVVALYIMEQGNTDASLVSPKAVLEIRSELSILELREVELIKSSLVRASGDFGSDEFIDSFRGIFIDDVMNNTDMTNFLFENLSIGGAKVREIDKNRNLLEDGIYPEGLTSFEDGEMSFGRAMIEKRVLLVAKEESSKINFPVDFSFEFERKYLIKNVSGSFEVTKV